MKKKLLMFAALLAVSAAPVWAAGINLGWLDCPSGPTYTLSRTFACASNAGTNTLFASYVAPAGIDNQTANTVIIDIQSDQAALPPWWTLGSGQCRPGSLLGNFDFTTGPGTCQDYWQGGATGGVNWGVLPNTTNRCRIKGVFALPAGSPFIAPLVEGVEYYSCKILVNNLKSTGLGACAGCSNQACIVLNEIILNQAAPSPPITSLINPAASNYCIWQAWTTSDPNNQCPAVTPARKATWGSIKALYR